MYEWVISYDSKETLQEIKKIGFIEYEPQLDLNFIVMKSYLSKETIMNIKGVIDCYKPSIGSFH